MKQILIFLLTVTLAHAGAGIGSVQTSATGTTFVPIATSGTAQKVDLMNTTGTAIEVRLGGTGSTFQVATGVGYTLTGLAALSQVEVRRADSSGTQVTLSYTYETKD